MTYEIHTAVDVAEADTLALAHFAGETLIADAAENGMAHVVRHAHIYHAGDKQPVATVFAPPLPTLRLVSMLDQDGSAVRDSDPLQLDPRD